MGPGLQGPDLRPRGLGNVINYLRGHARGLHVDAWMNASFACTGVDACSSRPSTETPGL